MALAYDGTPVSGRQTFGSSVYNMPNFSTSLAGSLVVLIVRNINEGIASVVGSTLGTFVRIGAEPPGPSTPFTTKIELYAKIASGPLTNEVVTITQMNNYDPAFAMFAVSGHNQTSEAAAFGTLVGNSAGAFNNVLPRNYTTTIASATVIAASGIDFGGTGASVGAGWTVLVNAAATTLHVQDITLSSTATVTATTNGDDALVGETLIFAIYEAAGGGGGISAAAAQSIAMGQSVVAALLAQAQAAQAVAMGQVATATAPAPSRGKPIFSRPTRIIRPRRYH